MTACKSLRMRTGECCPILHQTANIFAEIFVARGNNGEKQKRDTRKKGGTECSSSIHEAIEILAPASFANLQKDQCSEEDSNGEKESFDELVTDDTSVSCSLGQPKLTFLYLSRATYRREHPFLSLSFLLFSVHCPPSPVCFIFLSAFLCLFVRCFVCFCFAFFFGVSKTRPHTTTSISKHRNGFPRAKGKVRYGISVVYAQKGTVSATQDCLCMHHR